MLGLLAVRLRGRTTCASAAEGQAGRPRPVELSSEADSGSIVTPSPRGLIGPLVAPPTRLARLLRLARRTTEGPIRASVPRWSVTISSASLRDPSSRRRGGQRPPPTVVPRSKRSADIFVDTCRRISSALALAAFQLAMNRDRLAVEDGGRRDLRRRPEERSLGPRRSCWFSRLLAFVARVASRYFIFNAGRDVEYELRASPRALHELGHRVLPQDVRPARS